MATDALDVILVLFETPCIYYYLIDILSDNAEFEYGHEAA